MDVDGEPREISSTTKTGLFRVVQEALTNVVKHAGAGSANIRLTFGAEAITLQVEDDGCGFDTRILAMDSKRPSWGLLGMEERATELGGRFLLRSRIGEGTQIEVVVPYLDETGRSEDDQPGTGG